MSIPTISVSGTTLPYIEYQGTPVVTFAMIDAAHQRPQGTARRNFTANKRHLIEGDDFYLIDSNRLDEIRPIYSSLFPEAMKRVTFFTETGYLMLVKSFTDDLAWQVQRQLVKSYFRVKGAMQATAQPPIPEPLTHIQREELYKTVEKIFFPLEGRRAGAQKWLYNRLRTTFSVKRVEDLSQGEYDAAMKIVTAQGAKVAQYNALIYQIEESFLREVIGEGGCWTAWLSKQIGGAHKVGKKPDWKLIAQQIFKKHKLTASRD